MDDHTKRAEWIRWVDSVRLNSDWQRVPDDYTITSVDTLGFVLREDDDAVVIAMCVDPSNQMISGSMAIPKVAIVARWEIK